VGAAALTPLPAAIHPHLGEEKRLITIDDGALTISGSFPELHVADEAGNWSWYTRELRGGSFQRSFNLPFKVDVEGVSATIEDGLLWLTLPKAAEAKPRRIPVASGASQIHEVEATSTVSSE
jgi:HSP20 family protein